MTKEKIKSPSSIFLVGRERKLALPLKTIKRYREIMGNSLFAEFDMLKPTPEEKDFFTNERIDVITRITWASLIHDDPNLTLEEVEEELDLGTIMSVFKKLLDMINKSKPVEEPTDSSGGQKKEKPKK